MNKKWFYVLSSMLAAALAVVIILAATFHNTEAGYTKRCRNDRTIQGIQ